MKGLSKVQQHVVDLLGQGWELGVAQGIDPRAWLQQGGLGRGGKTEDVRSNTLYALWKRGAIVLKSDKFPTTRYELAPKKVLDDHN